MKTTTQHKLPQLSLKNQPLQQSWAEPDYMTERSRKIPETNNYPYLLQFPRVSTFYLPHQWQTFSLMDSILWHLLLLHEHPKRPKEIMVFK
jgi:hypothetical protein